MIVECIEKLVEKQNLTEEEAKGAMSEIMKGRAKIAQIAAFLTALRMKRETVEEIASFVRATRESGVKLSTNLDVVDTCGTGGDLIKTFNISTITAFVLAGADVPVAKHGNRAVTSRAGSADVLEALGVNINAPPKIVQRCLEKIGICFLFAPIFHPAMKYATKPRKDMRIRTVFNIIGPLTNPFGAKKQILGVYSRELVEKMANVLGALGCKRGFVFHGEGGLDEFSTIGKTYVCEITETGILKTEFVPEDFGLKKANMDDILGGDLRTNMKIFVDILKGEKGAKRDIVLANSALGMIASGKTEEIKEAILIAEESIDSGKALKKLESLIKESGGESKLAHYKNHENNQ